MSVHFMPLTSVAIGLAAAIGIGAATDVIAPRQIDVVGLEYIETCQWGGLTYHGCIAQERHVAPPDRAETFSALWQAQVISVATDTPVQWCTGRGGDDYQAGHAVIVMPLQVWTGQHACRAGSLPPGEYYTRGTWRWGTHSETHVGTVFRIPSAETP